jgi:exonuclease SbcC
MKPVRLTIQAFGPFAGREVVDFRDGVASGLFGIYGQTGSGKSTIFSAMTFSLFGEASKPEQDATSLRSDHADPSLPTEVEFVFDIGERRFLVRRRPDQTRPKQRGTGETCDPHVAWLFDATGLTVEEISGGNTGKIIAEKKVGAVREAVTDLLGYGAEQFRQIVLLPQGKFETFLAAKTDARLAILRELFDVSLYRRLAAKLKEDSAAIERKVRQDREVCVARVTAEGFESTEALAEGIDAVQIQHEDMVRSEAEAAKAVNGARTELETANKLEALFIGAEKAKSDLRSLLANTDDMCALKDRITNARRAQTIVDVEDFLLETTGDVSTRTEKAEEKLRLSEAASSAADAASEALKTERARENEIDDLRKEIEGIERLQRTLAEAEGLEALAQEATNVLATEQGKLDANDQLSNELLGQKNSHEQYIRVARDNESARRDLKAAHASLDAALQAAERFEKAEKARDDANIKVSRLKTELEGLTDLADDAKASFEIAEANLAAAQAMYLAAKLVHGEACPVCGSSEHPAPATGSSEHAGLDAAFRSAKTIWEKARHERQQGERLLASAEGALKERQDRLAELPKPDQSAASLREQLGAVTQEIEALGDEIDFAASERRLAALAREVMDAEACRDAARAIRDEAKQQEGLARGRLEQALSTIPAELRDKDAIERALATARDTMAKRKAARDAAETAAGAGREAALAAKKDADAAKESLADAVRRREKADASFRGRLAESGLTESLYQSFKPLIGTIENDIATVDEFERHLDIARQNDESAHNAIAGSERPDLKPLDAALQQAEDMLKRETDKRAQVAARLHHIQKLRSEISEALLRLDQAEAESASLRGLAALFNAENGLRLDLETYAIGAMFDQVLHSANQRLGPMTNGRYSLDREAEENGGRARRGLGIRVLDVYTGKPRSPSTLSGGETFIAALALALGLSDVVESVSGKVRLDTIFIDEGFGSLDTDNDSGTLDLVLQALTDLVSQRRSVGLISHVPLVQGAIPNGFYVRKEVRGSRIEVRGAN